MLINKLKLKYVRSRFPIEWCCYKSGDKYIIRKLHFTNRVHRIFEYVDPIKSDRKIYSKIEFDDDTYEFINDVMGMDAVTDETRIEIDYENSNTLFVTKFTFNTLMIDDLIGIKSFLNWHPLKKYADIQERRVIPLTGYELHDVPFPLKAYIRNRKMPNAEDCEQVYQWMLISKIVELNEESSDIELLRIKAQILSVLTDMGVYSESLHGELQNDYIRMNDKNKLTHDMRIIRRIGSIYYVTTDEFDVLKDKWKTLKLYSSELMIKFILKQIKKHENEIEDCFYLECLTSYMREFDLIRSNIKGKFSKYAMFRDEEVPIRLQMIQIGRSIVDIKMDNGLNIVSHENSLQVIAIGICSYLNQLGLMIPMANVRSTIDITLYSSINIISGSTDNPLESMSTFTDTICKIGYSTEMCKYGNFPLLILDKALTSTHILESTKVIAVLINIHRKGVMIINTLNHKILELVR